MYEKIHEQIDVFANFTNKGAEPICFAWNNTDYNVTSINFIHKAMQGNLKVFHYAVTANNETYKLSFIPEKLEWILEEIYINETLKQASSLNDKAK